MASFPARNPRTARRKPLASSASEPPAAARTVRPEETLRPSGLAGVREQVVVPAGVAIDPCKPVMRVAAPDEALDHLRLERATQPARGAQFRAVPLRALAQRARARIAR